MSAAIAGIANVPKARPDSRNFFIQIPTGVTQQNDLKLKSAAGGC
jgi:hypothetical protein